MSLTLPCSIVYCDFYETGGVTGVNDLHGDMSKQLASKELFEQARQYAYDYMDQLGGMNVFPSEKALQSLNTFNEDMPAQRCSAGDVLKILHDCGSVGSVSYGGGKYFGFVNGGVLPITLASRWLSDTWDQNAALHVMSPIAAKLEEICERWLGELLGLPVGTAAGFVSGSSVASLCAITAARNKLLLNQGHDVHVKGLFGAPKIRVVVGAHVHSSLWKVFSMVGIGREMVEIVPVDHQGRMIADKLPALDDKTLVIAQAGNVNGGVFDPLDEIGTIANKARAWVHIDGAFGLWAAASAKRGYLTKGIEKADSWSVDAHKTLNIPYDCGIVLCKDKTALVSALQANASYIEFSDKRDGMLYTPEMSKRARGVELWAALKYLGKSGVRELVDGLCDHAVYFAEKLKENGFTVLNDVVFNQILFQCGSADETSATLKNIQASGTCWCSGAVWFDEPVIRISVCSWQTTKSDIDDCVKTFVECKKAATNR